MSALIELIPKRLYWTNGPVPKTKYTCVYTTDDLWTYRPFNEDFGPVNMSMLHSYCDEIDRLLSSHKLLKFKIYLSSSPEFDKVANSVLLFTAYQVLVHSVDPEIALQPFLELELTPFRDALESECSFEWYVIDWLYALKKA